MLWTAKLETGLPKIDEQHKELFKQAEILTDKTKADRIPETIKFLGDYVVRHFLDEQGLQASVTYPKAGPHKELHNAFTARFGELKKKFEDSGDKLKLEVVMEINRTVVGWLKEHIMTHDREFADYYKQKRGIKPVGGGARPAAGKAAPPRVAGPRPRPKFWRAEYETGIPKLDEQHKELFRQTEILMDRSKADLVPATLKFLGDYVVRHFGAEEKAQASIRYPRAGAHKMLHEEFTRKFTEMKGNYEAAPDEAKYAAIMQLERVAVAWLKEHIMAQDKDFANYYKKFHQAAGSGRSSGPVRERRGFLYRLLHFFK
ncbi:MAG: hemerythrin family protein [Candidatus Adiutrix sp.]|jgi:hemerythrin|nr:hemerythrin family protein [Candidatus Adiutrix sp.]